MAEEFGFKMACETHMGYLTDLPEPTAKLQKMIGLPAVGANLDYGNMVYSPNAPALSEGPLCIEPPRQVDREWFAQQDLQFLKSVLKELGW